MKRLICILLANCLMLSGCSLTRERIKEPVTFYYIQEDFQKDMEQLLASEFREASGHRDDLTYLLALYSMGPSSEDLKSPIPGNTMIIPTARTEDSIELSLSENALTLTDSEFTLAGACIALTCMGLINVQQVTIACGDRNITIRDNLLLSNTSVVNQQEELH